MPGRPHAEWHTADVVRRARVRAGKGLDAAGRVLAAEIAQTLSVPGNGFPSPPGSPPHKQSGQLVRAVGSRRVAADRVWAGVVTEDQWPKAVRLARGFVGTDSLGRRYNQRIRPYVTPAFRRINKRLVASFTTGAR